MASFTLPSTMQGISVPNPGKDSGRLVWGEHSTPHPQAGEVLIQVSHAGVNRADIFQRQGNYPAPEGASPLPGLEVSGHIVALGDNVRGWNIGDAVCALLPGGGYAEYAIAKAGHMLPVPHGWSLAEAAALPEALITVWMALHVEARLQKDEYLLIHGGASGIGMLAIMYAKHIGAEVIVTAGSDEKCVACESWGATHTINYREKDFVSEVKRITKNLGAHVIVDYIGGDYVEKNFASLASDGRMITLAFLRGSRIENLNIAPLLFKRITWKGTTLRARSDEEKSRFVREIRDALSMALSKGYIKPHIDKIFAITDAEKAHSHMEDNLNVGKIILAVASVHG